MIYYEIFSHNKPKYYIHLQITAKNYDSTSILAPKHDQIDDTKKEHSSQNLCQKTT